MTSFKERELAFETRFSRENEALFLVNAKACALFARWIAEEKLGMKKEAADRYCDTVISLTIRDCNPTTLFNYTQKKLKKHKVTISERELEHHYLKALATASIQTA